MDENSLEIQLLSLQNSLASSNEKSLNAELKKLENLEQCVSGCYKKMEMLLHKAILDKTTITIKENHIKDLEIKLAKLEGNLAMCADKIEDKDDIITALRMSIDIYKKNNYHSNESQSQIDQLKASLRERNNQLEDMESQIRKKDIQLKESDAKLVCFFNQIQQMNVHLREYESMIKLTSDPKQILLQSREQIAARDRHIEELCNIIKSKDAQIDLCELELSSIKDDSRTQIDNKAKELKEKTDLLDNQEGRIKNQEIVRANLESKIAEKDEKLKEVERLLAMCKAQLKEKNDKQTDKLLKEYKAKISSYTNTIKQLKQNISDLQIGTTETKNEISTQKETIKIPNIQMLQMAIDSELHALPEDVRRLILAGWTVFSNVTAFSESFNSIIDLNVATTKERHELFIRLEDFFDIPDYAQYDNFVVGNESEYYKIKSLGKYSGMAGDGMRSCEGNGFTIIDCDPFGAKSRLNRRYWGLVETPQGANKKCDKVTSTFTKTIWWMGEKYKSILILTRPIESSPSGV